MDDTTLPLTILWAITVVIYAVLWVSRIFICYTILLDIVFFFWSYLHVFGYIKAFLLFLIVAIYFILVKLVWQYYSDEFNDLYENEIRPDFYEDLYYDLPYLRHPDALFWKLFQRRKPFIHEPIFLFLVSLSLKVVEGFTIKMWFVTYNNLLAFFFILSLVYLLLVTPRYAIPFFTKRWLGRPHLRKIFITDFACDIMDDRDYLDRRVLDLQKDDPDMDRLELILERPKQITVLYTHQKLRISILFRRKAVVKNNKRKLTRLRYKRFTRLRWHYSPIISIFNFKRPGHSLYVLSVSFRLS